MEKTTIELGPDNLKSQIQEENMILVDFWAKWCGPCKLLGPIFENLSNDYLDKIKFAKFDIDLDRDLVKSFGINQIPTLILFKNGKEVGRMVGGGNKESLKSQLDNFLS